MKNMENKKVGLLVLGISFLIFMIILIFNQALKKIVSASCGMLNHLNCAMYDTITQQTYMALAIVGILLVFGIFLMVSKPAEKIVIRKIKENKIVKKLDTSQLKPEEKKVLDFMRENKAMFQADLIEKTGFGKAKMTRIIDRLEGKGFVERKRRGLTNVVVLKD